FSARTVAEVAALLRAMGRHRYVREADHRLHWSVDEALSDRAPFDARAARFREKRAKEPDIDPGSRDPSLWTYADTEVVIDALSAFWAPDERAGRAQGKLAEALAGAEIELAVHAPFQSNSEDPPHPELVLLDWEFYPIDELDPE